jgi:hypothetical protein
MIVADPRQGHSFIMVVCRVLLSSTNELVRSEGTSKIQTLAEK